VETGSAPALASELRVVLGQLIRRLRVEHRFPLSHGSVLGRLDREGTRTISGLAAAERVRPQSMAATIGELEGGGLVARRPDPSDGRKVLIELTPVGRAALRDDREQREGWLAGAIETSLTAREQVALEKAVVLLRRLAER
jgi:DNA-binding MarR family transcriptional regulator